VERLRFCVAVASEELIPMSDAAPLTRIAGPTALAAGVLMVAAEVVMWPFDPDQHVATTTDPVFQIGGVVYFVAFCLLVVALTAAYEWQARSAGRFGVVGLVAALVGTLAMAGDLWFETFAVPWLADEVPTAFDATPTLLLALGANFSYLSFALGWALFGLASLRAGVFPRGICYALVVGGLLGYAALVAPFGAFLGLAVAALGTWMIRARRRTVEPAEPREGADVPKGALPTPRTAADVEAPSPTAPHPGTPRP
jgi:hypothetical protein